MRNKKEFKERSKELKRERRIKLEQRRNGMILENTREFLEATIRGEEHPILCRQEKVKLW